MYIFCDLVVLQGKTKFVGRRKKKNCRSRDEGSLWGKKGRRKREESSHCSPYHRKFCFFQVAGVSPSLVNTLD